MSKKLQHFIAGKAVAGTSGRAGEVYDPATGAVTARVPFADGEEARRAVAAAAAAFPDWSRRTPAARARFLFTYKALLEARRDELAELISAEHGKTLDDARASVERGIEVVAFACGAPELLKGGFSESVGTGVDGLSIRQPLGVCVGITPFNFPAMVPLWMFPLALVCGNTFVLKPSEKDPSCPFLLARLAHEAGVPEGVLNLVHGDGETVSALLADPEVAAVSFVGSTPVAERVHGGAQGKRVQALGGAKNHMVVMPDADVSQATDALMNAAFGSAGERCMAVSVAVAVGDGVADALVERLAPRVAALRIGPYTDPDAEMGPLVSRAHLDRVRGYIESGLEDGAALVVDGREIRLQGYEDGFFLGGCLFDRVTPLMRIYREEIFGPVLSLVRVADYEAALALVNDHPLGNGCAIFTRDGEAARDFSGRARIGMVGVNVAIPIPAAHHSFGGWKGSLFGDFHIYGPEAVRFYTRLKYIATRWPSRTDQRTVAFGPSPD